MLNRIKQYQDQIYSVLIGLFFILILHIKVSYSLIPILLTLSGIVLIISAVKQKTWQLGRGDKWLIASFLFYFLLFVGSLIVHQGKMSELDLPSRALLVLPILVLCYQRPLKHTWILIAILIANFIAGIVGSIQIFILQQEKPFSIMHIQAGDMAMTMALFAFCALFYFYAKKQYMLMYLSLFSGAFGMVASFLTGARGAWIGVPVMLLFIFLLNRQNLSKWVVSAVLFISAAGVIFASDMLHKRYLDAEYDITSYMDNSNTSTSVGARFDMWKSAVLAIQEKPIFGWGYQGVKNLRETHFEEGKISKYASGFVHAHNQYLHDMSVRGIFGLVALLGVLLVPLAMFWRNLGNTSPQSLSHLWSVLGVTHILMMMSYFLSQSFLSHNSGMLFYFTTVVMLLGLQKNAKKRPLAEAH